jgi:hypothetical protein
LTLNQPLQQNFLTVREQDAISVLERAAEQP